ncbi:SpoIID/LytB domain-containing protein [Rhodococcus kronopolitis]|uniref:SpoIID/LytB domain-containing protein n=1 Tax=Rhodococcus kronopolitis TaxID=1460226 RepID=A0ABV9FZT1_9NOCA
MVMTRRKKFTARRAPRVGWAHLAFRALTLGVAPALVVGAGVGVVAARGSGGDVVAAVAADTPFTVSGHGHGHGRGMGQWGAYGYAAEQGWGAERIIGHYYGGTALEQLPPRGITVRLMGLDGQGLNVTSDAGLTVADRPVAPGEAAHLTAMPDGGASVTVTKGCDGEVLWQGVTANPWVDPVNLGADRPALEHLKLCGGNSFRGSLGVALEGAEPRVVNHVDLEDYLLGVVPVESRPEWADTGGAEALRAQAIAARSYAASEGRYGYAETCDTQACQVYGGSTAEDSRTTEAVRSTAGNTLVRDGVPVPAEFSASTGGFTAGGEFAAVEDGGDASAPVHNWTQTLTAGEIAEAFGVGELQTVTVTSRNGLGADGGRVTGMRVVGADKTVDVTGDDARTALGLKSDWFTIVEGLTPAPSTPAAPPTGAEQAPPAAPGEPAPEGVAPSEIEKKYAELGGENGVLGKPIGPELSMPDEAGRFRMYTRGTIVWTPITGAQVIDASVLESALPGTGSAG